VTADFLHCGGGAATVASVREMWAGVYRNWAGFALVGCKWGTEGLIGLWIGLSQKIYPVSIFTHQDQMFEVSLLLTWLFELPIIY